LHNSVWKTPSSPLVVIALNTLSIRSLLERIDNLELENSDDDKT
jgi:hypothetical protein